MENQNPIPQNEVLYSEPLTEETVIDTFIGKERANELLKSANMFLESQAKSILTKLEIEKIEVQNAVKIAEIEKDNLIAAQKSFADSDIRNKGFALVALVLIFAVLYFFSQEGFITKETTNVLFTGTITTVIFLGMNAAPKKSVESKEP